MASTHATTLRRSPPRLTLGGMRSRLLWAGLAAAVLAVAAVAWWGTGGTTRRQPGARTPTAAGPRGESPPTSGRPGRQAPPPRRPRAPAPATNTVTVGGVTIEGVGIYDPESPEVKANLFEFKKSRLRFALYDAAADCWAGGDDVSDLEVTYTMIVEGEVLRLENVTMTDSTMPDPDIERCILGRLRELRSPATDIPDLREDGSSWIALHDLYTRNRRER